MTRNHRIDDRGFTLMALMVTIVVVATSAAVVYPTYMSYVRETGRGDAYGALLDLASSEERYFTRYHAYTDVLIAPVQCTGAGCGLDASSMSNDGYYELAAAAGSTRDLSTSFLLTATVKNGRRQAGDERCAVLTIDSFGETTPSECW